MNLITMPTPSSLRMTSVSLELQAALGTDCRYGLICLWSLAVDHGAGPYRPLAVEIACEWRGPSGLFIEALLDAGCLEQDADGSVTIRAWQDVLGYVEPAPANETPEDRRRRQKRESMRRSRAAKVHPQSDRRSVDMRGQNVDIAWTSVDKRGHSVDIGGRSVDMRGQNVDIGGQKTDPSRARSLFLLSSSEKNSEAEPEAEAEKSLVGSTADAVSRPASPAGFGAAPRLTESEPVEQASLFSRKATSTTDRPTAGGQERPALGSGSTIDPPVVSVPVPTPDRASGGASGGPAKKARGSRKAAVDPTAVEEPIRQVWTAYAEVVGTRVVLSKERAALIAARLADGWTAEELVTAVKGFGKSAWHFGANDRGTRFTSLELWLRDAAHVEQGLGYHKETAKPQQKAGEFVKTPRNGIEDTLSKYFAENGEGDVVFR